MLRCATHRCASIPGSSDEFNKVGKHLSTLPSGQVQEAGEAKTCQALRGKLPHSVGTALCCRCTRGLTLAAGTFPPTCSWMPALAGNCGLNSHTCAHRAMFMYALIHATYMQHVNSPFSCILPTGELRPFWGLERSSGCESNKAVFPQLQPGFS